MTNTAAGGKREVLSVLVAQSVLLLSSVVLQVLLAWWLLPAGRGTYAVYAVLAAILPVLFTLGADRAIQYHLMAGRSQPRQAFGAMLLVAGMAALLSMVAALLAPPALTQLGPATAAATRWAVMALLVTAAFHSCLLRLLTAKRNFGDYLTANVVQGTVNVAAIVLLVPILGFGLTGAVTAFAASYAAGAFYTSVRLLRLYGLPAALPRAEVPAHRAYGLRYYPALVAHSVDFNLGTLALAALVTASEVGLFAAVSALMLRFLVVAQALQEVMLPRIAAGGSGKTALVVQLSRLSFTSTALVALAFAAVSHWVLPLLLSPRFAAAASLTWLITPGLALHASSSLLMPHFEGTNRPQVVSLAMWLGLLANALVLFLLVPSQGAAGAALALSIGMAIRFTALLVAFYRETGVGATELLRARFSDLQLLMTVLPTLRRSGR